MNPHHGLKPHPLKDKQSQDERRLVRLMLIVAVAGIIASLLLPFVF